MKNLHRVLISSALICLPFLGMAQVQVDKPAASGKNFGHVLEVKVSTTQPNELQGNATAVSSSSDVPGDSKELNVIQWDNVPVQKERPSSMNAVLVESPEK